MSDRFKRPIVYWPLIGACAALLTKGGSDEWSAWVFWLSISFTIALVLEWRRTEKIVFALLVIPCAVLSALLFQESIRQPGTFTTSVATDVLKKPFPLQYGTNRNLVVKTLSPRTTYTFDDTVFGKDFAMYVIKLNGEDRFVESNGLESVQMMRPKFPWEKLIFWIWIGWLLFVIFPLSLLVGFASERERFRFAKISSRSQGEIFLKLWVPPFSWRMGKEMGPSRHLLLTKTLVIYIALWFWAPFVALQMNIWDFDFGDWVQFALLCLLTCWVLWEVYLAHRRCELRRLILPDLLSPLSKQDE